MHLTTSFEGAVSVPKNTAPHRGSHDPYARRLDPKWHILSARTHRHPCLGALYLPLAPKTSELHPPHHDALYNIAEYTFKKMGTMRVVSAREYVFLHGPVMSDSVRE